MAERQCYPPAMIDAILAEKRQHRHSHTAWSEWINSLKAGPTLDILVYDTECAPGDESELHTWHMAPLSDDLGEVMSHALSESVEHISFTAVNGYPMTIEVEVISGWNDPVSETYTGTGKHTRAGDDENCQGTERPGLFDTYNACRAHALCLAILDMYSPTEEELSAG